MFIQIYMRFKQTCSEVRTEGIASHPEMKATEERGAPNLGQMRLPMWHDLCQYNAAFARSEPKKKLCWRKLLPQENRQTVTSRIFGRM